MSRFPVAFRPPAFASRSSDSRRGVGPSLRSAYRIKIRTSTGLPRCARSSCDRGGCLLYPEGGGALLASPYRQPAPAALRRPALLPRSSIPSAGVRMTRHQRRFKPFTRPVCPSPVAPGWDGRPWVFPELRTPPARSRQRTSGWGQAMSTSLGLHVRHQSILPSVCPLDSVHPRCRNTGSGRAVHRITRWMRSRHVGSVVSRTRGCWIVTSPGSLTTFRMISSSRR